MTTDETQSNLDDTVLEELTAYLDGELDEATQLAVETRLGEDPKYLSELHSLQRTWDTLDELPMVCLLYTSPSPRDQRGSRMPSSA